MADENLLKDVVSKDLPMFVNFPIIKMQELLTNEPKQVSANARDFWQSLRMPSCEMHLRFWKMADNKSEEEYDFGKTQIDKWTDKKGLICEGMKVKRSNPPKPHGLVRLTNLGHSTKALYEPIVSQRTYKHGVPHGLWFYISEDKVTLYMT